MPRYELSLSENYVSDWGVVEAVREIFQNALDQETQQEDNPMFFTLGATHVAIGNKASRLDIKSLLLGESTKRDDESTIGKFGEGYKLALLVLARLGKKVVIYNYQAREVWASKLVESKKYAGAKILTITVQNNYFWQKVPNNDLTYVIDGLTPKELEEIKRSNLHVQPPAENTVLNVTQGQILTSHDQKGRVYVNGLFVSEVDTIKYGYNIKPQFMKLDRDRKMVNHFDLTWVTSSMWKESGDTRIVTLLKDKAEDIRYFDNSWSCVSYTNTAAKMDIIANEAYADFRKDQGKGAFPVVNQADVERFYSIPSNMSKYRPVIVTDTFYSLLKRSEQYKKEEREMIPSDKPELTPSEALQEFYNLVRDELSGEHLNILWNLVIQSSKWKKVL